MTAKVGPRLGAAVVGQRPPAAIRPVAPRRRARLSAAGVAGLAILLALLLLALLGPRLIDADPAKQALRDRLAPPLGFGGAGSHPLGTDGLGRDLLARLAAGARVSLVIGAAATLLAGAAGVTLGVLAGYLGGTTDRIVTFLADVQLALPFVVVAIASVATLGGGTRNVIIVLAVTGSVGYTRVIRLEVARLRTAPFVDAARALGASRWRVMGRHVIPNISGPIVVIASQQVAAMILYEAALSYLGLGVPARTITWGSMVADGRESLLTAWWVPTVPGLAIALTVLGLSLAGDWLQDRLAPASSARESKQRLLPHTRTKE